MRATVLRWRFNFAITPNFQGDKCYEFFTSPKYSICTDYRYCQFDFNKDTKAKGRQWSGINKIHNMEWQPDICAVRNYLWAVLKSRSPVKSLAKKINRHSKTGGLPGSSAATPNYQEIANRGESNAIK